MKVSNMISNNGNPIPNQFVITEDTGHWKIEYFQSYNSIIAKRSTNLESPGEIDIELDSHYWNYSVTTSRYRNQFLRETTKETQRKIDSGEYQLTDLNS